MAWNTIVGTGDNVSSTDHNDFVTVVEVISGSYFSHSGNKDIHFPSSNLTTWLDNIYAQSGASATGTNFYVYPDNVEVSPDGLDNIYISGQNGIYVYSGSNTIIISSQTATVDKIILKKSSATEDIQTPQVIGWDVEEEKGSGFTHSNVTNNERITINADGTYVIIGNVNTVNTGANRATGYMDLRINGVADTDTRSKGYSRGSAYGDFRLLVSTIKVLSANDYIDLYCGIDDADQADAVNTTISQSEFMVVKVSGGPKGEDGANGPAGADGDITWEGNWSAGQYTANQAVASGGRSFVATQTTSNPPGHADWDLMAASGGKGDPGDITHYMYPIWAEENSTLASSAYEWAFGNGANSALDDGITIYVPTGVRSATNDSFTPLSISNNDYITFRTTSVDGSTAAPNVVTAWLKMETT